MNYRQHDQLKRMGELKRCLLKENSEIKISSPICSGMGLEFVLTYRDIRITFPLDDVDKVEGMVYLLLDKQNEWKKYI